MTRAHLYRPVTDAAGNIRQNAVVRVLEPGTTTPITDALYANNTGTATLANPGIFNTGVIDFYLEKPRRVRLGVRFGTGAEFFFEDVDVTITGSFRAQDIAIEADPNFVSTNVQGALYELASDINQAQQDAMRLPRSEGLALYTPATPTPLVNGELVALNWLDATPEPTIVGNDDLRWEDLTGSWVVNTAGYYSFSVFVRLDGFTADAAISACAEARLVSPRVPDAVLSSVVPPNQTVLYMSATTQTALYEVEDNIDLRGFRAFFGAGSPVVGAVEFSASRVGLIDGVGQPGNAEVEALLYPSATTYPSTTTYPRSYAALS